MRNKIIELCILVLLTAGGVFAQNSTTVTVNVTDAGSTAWANGTYQFQFVGQIGSSWPGGGLANLYPTAPGALNGSGSASQSVPSNATITPSPSYWNLTVCPSSALTLPGSGCYTQQYTVKGSSQTINITPPAISIPVPSVPTNINPVVAYADSEISGGWTGFTYFNVTSLVNRTCTALSGSTCSTWISGGGGGVTSFTGDGTLINNVASIGAIVVTLGNTPAYAGLANSFTAANDFSGATLKVPQAVACLPTLIGLLCQDATNKLLVFGTGSATGSLLYATTRPSGTGQCPTSGDLFALVTWITCPVAAGTTNTLAKYTGANALGNSLLSDNGTTLTYTGSGGVSASLLTATGPNAGASVYGQGTAQGHATANTATLEGPVSITSAYELQLFSAPCSGLWNLTNTSGVMASSCVAATSGTVTSVDGSASNGVQSVQGGAIAAITTGGTIQASQTLDTQTGVTSYAHINGDRGKLLVRSNSGTAMTDTLSAAASGATASFGPGWTEEILNTDTSASDTITATTSTFSGTGTTVLVIPAGTWCKITSDGTNYKNLCSGGSPAITSTTLATVTNPTISTDTKMTELALPKGYLNTLGQGYLIRAGGLYSNTAAASPALTFTAKLCTVSGCGSGTVVSLGAIVSGATSATATTNNTWTYSLFVVTNATGATGNVLAKGDPGLVIDLSNVVSNPDTVYTDVNTAVSSNIDLTAALFLDFTVAQSVAGASNVYKQLSAMIAPQSNPAQAIGGAGSSTVSYIFPMATTSGSGSVGGVTQNNIRIWPVFVPVATTTLNKLFYNVQTADNTANSYDIGWYGPGCLNGASNVPLAFHSGTIPGTTFASSTGIKDVPLTGAPVIGVASGWYCVAYTSSAASPAAVLNGDSSTNYYLPFNWAGTGTITGGGATLPSTITAPALSWGGISSVWAGARQ